jgi:hypothetical protein
MLEVQVCNKNMHEHGGFLQNSFLRGIRITVCTRTNVCLNMLALKQHRNSKQDLPTNLWRNPRDRVDPNSRPQSDILCLQQPF